MTRSNLTRIFHANNKQLTRKGFALTRRVRKEQARAIARNYQDFHSIGKSYATGKL